MSAAILHEGATVNCSHSPGIAKAMFSSSRVKVSGQNVVTVAHGWKVSGCGLSASSSTFCINGQFTQGVQRVKVEGSPVVTLASSSTCTETGAPLQPIQAQSRVRAG